MELRIEIGIAVKEWN